MKIFRLLLLPLTVTVLVLWSCTHQKETAMPAKPIEQVLREHTDSLMAIPGVVGTAQGACDDKPCIKILVRRKTPDLEKRIPTTLEGWKVAVEEVGDVRAR